MSATILYHNQKCATSRKVLAMLEESGRPFERVDYLSAGWTLETLRGLAAATGLSPQGLLRRKEPLAAALGLTAPTCPEARILEAMLAHPVLVERPILVVGALGAVCRPPERAAALLSL
jgi:arsenate reductase